MKSPYKFALGCILGFVLVGSGCKKDDSSTASSSIKTSLRINNVVYTPLIAEYQFDTAQHSSNMMCLASNGTDSVFVVTLFNSVEPSIGNHSLDTLNTDASLIIFPSSFMGNMRVAVSGKCAVSRASDMYTLNFTDVDLVDSAMVHSTLSGGYKAGN